MELKPASRQPAHRSRWVAAAVAAAAGFAVFQFFGNASRGYIETSSLFYWWGFQWMNAASETQHGWMILALSVWLLWRNVSGSADSGSARANLTTAGALPSASPSGYAQIWAVMPAAAALVAGLALHGLGFAAQQSRISVVALLIFAWGLLRLGGGRKWGRAAVFPLAFLIFALPLSVLDSLGFGLWLRLRVVDASMVIAQLANIEVLRSGTQLVAPDGTYNYDVADACSGVRSLTAMAALSLLAGYLNFQSWPRRALVLLACFPLVYLGNVARIVSIIFAAEAGGPAWGDRAHEVMGYGVFVIVFGGVLVGISALRRWLPEAELPVADIHPPDDAEGGDRQNAPAFAVAGLIAALAAGEMGFLRALSRSPAKGDVGVVLAADGVNPVELPGFIGTEWIGRRAEITAVERAILPPDTGYSRKTYVAFRDPREQVFLSIVLSGRDRTSIHRPELCLVGQGWTIGGKGDHRFAHPGEPDRTFPVTILRVQREIRGPRGKIIVPQLTAYWFVGADVVAGSHGDMFFRDAWQRLTQARADRWAYVLMQTDAVDGEAAALTRMQTVLEAALPIFQRPQPGR